jgi:hypothetical protein
MGKRENIHGVARHQDHRDPRNDRPDHRARELEHRPESGYRLSEKIMLQQ